MDVAFKLVHRLSRVLECKDLEVETKISDHSQTRMTFTKLLSASEIRSLIITRFFS